MSDAVVTFKNCVGGGYPELSNHRQVKQTAAPAQDSSCTYGRQQNVAFLQTDKGWLSTAV